MRLKISAYPFKAFYSISVYGATSGGLCHHVESFEFVLQQTKTEFQNLEIACEITSKSEKDKLSRDMRVLFICVIKYLLK